MRVKAVPSKCSGCKLCLTFCDLRGLMLVKPERAGGKVLLNGFDAPSVDFDFITDVKGKGSGCGEVVEACPTGALYLSEE